ncbi:Glycine betaine/carnitine/choline transport ATP-binding protein OpuCA [Sporomusa ovata DSM 2662]|uniref:Quaternary amine transport ATP-binding protein n=1 Tax=Sporomusa ovata TaxID=2378 RepID=A0A0U1KXZ3_9FIRM|nr:ABC transporter ATP-binding protein [Sporomusa ovata]EQB28360.1 glycine betaine/carnitine/choline transport ATP-binding protein OpuCA [Sporomusa ovata DSM 2662]CQR71999.1 L-proline glycine betaine ABC transport system permease protein ProV (TC 3.A.1.12.1) [Sporomusa ovata]
MIELINVSKTFATNQLVLDNINLSIGTGEFVVLIGPSGCGKTTTMRMINRLISPTSGQVKINGENVNNFDPVELRRNIGYVIQSIGLFPHMTIAENIAIVPNLQGATQAECEKKAGELIELVGLKADQFLWRYPYELSGGQQQRIGVARALAADPEVVLMDEPFGALDPITRENLQDELLRIQRDMRKTIVFVTHDMDEAIKLGDRIVVMKDGKILQADTPEKIMLQPAHGFVEEFIGARRLLKQPEWISVKDIMISNPVVCYPELKLERALQRMQQGKVDSLLVVDESRHLLGMVTALDIHRKLDVAATIAQVMKSPEITVKSDDNLRMAINLMGEHDLRYLPVVNPTNQLLGLVTRGSLVRVIAENM